MMLFSLRTGIALLVRTAWAVPIPPHYIQPVIGEIINTAPAQTMGGILLSGRNRLHPHIVVGRGPEWDEYHVAPVSHTPSAAFRPHIPTTRVTSVLGHSQIHLGHVTAYQDQLQTSGFGRISQLGVNIINEEKEDAHNDAQQSAEDEHSVAADLHRRAEHEHTIAEGLHRSYAENHGNTEDIRVHTSSAQYHRAQAMEHQRSITRHETQAQEHHERMLRGPFHESIRDGRTSAREARRSQVAAAISRDYAHDIASHMAAALAHTYSANAHTDAAHVHGEMYDRTGEYPETYSHHTASAQRHLETAHDHAQDALRVQQRTGFAASVRYARASADRANRSENSARQSARDLSRPRSPLTHDGR